MPALRLLLPCLAAAAAGGEGGSSGAARAEAGTAAAADQGRPSDCARRRAEGECLSSPVRAALECPADCEADLAESELRGRRLVEGVLPEAAARELFRLAPEAVAWGDGYKGRGDRPFSQAERFGGVAPSAAATWAVSQPEDGGRREEAVEWAWQLIAACRKAKDATERQFNLTAGLEADFLHLTCREHAPDGPSDRPDSHPAHADNCYPSGGTECVRGPPMYHWRSHSAIVALNSPGEGSFSGGDFFYTPAWDRGPRTRVTPRAGRMVAFTAGPENIHGVEAVTRGIRCQLAAWFTDDLDRAMHATELAAAEEVLRGAGGSCRAAGPGDARCSESRGAASDSSGRA